MARARVVLNRAGMRDLLRRETVRADLHARAERVAAAAKAANILVEGIPGDEPLPVEVDSSIGRNRARATVSLHHPSGVAVEAKHSLLTHSLDAAG
jgi:hypothetical protein